jgi:hypothetical protein
MEKGFFWGWVRSLFKNNDDQFPRAGDRGKGLQAGVGRIVSRKVDEKMFTLGKKN